MQAPLCPMVWMRIQSEDLSLTQALGRPVSWLLPHVVSFIFCVAMDQLVVCSQTLGTERESATWSQTSKGPDDTFVGPLMLEGLGLMCPKYSDIWWKGP